VSFLYYARRYDDALRQVQRTFELDSTFFQLAAERARVLVELRRCDEAVAAIARSPELTAAMLQGIRGYTYARCGHREQAIRELDHLLTQQRAGKYVSHYALAMIQAGLGDKEAALAELESAFTERAWTMIMLTKEPAFDVLRSDPRFVQLESRVGLI
jgi:tetratricopeptide (TPR) repeat protein